LDADQLTTDELLEMIKANERSEGMTTTANTTTTEKESTTWRELYPPLSCADALPMLGDDELTALAEDIQTNGLREPIKLVRQSGKNAEGYFDVNCSTYRVMDGRNRLQALVRGGVRLPSDPQKEALFPDGRKEQIFKVESIAEDDIAAFVISLNIKRRHLTKEQQAALIVQVIEAAAKKNGRLSTNRSFSPTPGQRGGSTKDALFAAAVVEAAKHDISKATVKVARAKLAGKTTAPNAKPKQTQTHLVMSPVVVTHQTRELTIPAVKVVTAPPASMRVLANAFRERPHPADDEQSAKLETAAFTAVDDVASAIEAIVEQFPASTWLKAPKRECQRCSAALRRWLKTGRAKAERRRATRRTTH
jgi:hypothetical protein